MVACVEDQQFRSGDATGPRACAATAMDCSFTMSGLTDRARTIGILVVLLSTSVALTGCSRGLYRRQADRESHYLIREKSVGTPWAIPESYTIAPDPRSRFFDPTHPDFPMLPPAGPQLYQYQLPELSHRGSRKSESLPPPLRNEPDDARELPAPPDVARVGPSRPGSMPVKASPG